MESLFLYEYERKTGFALRASRSCIGNTMATIHLLNKNVINKGVVALTMLLDEKKNATQLSTCIWALGHIGKHSPVHSKALADTNAYTKILEVYIA